MPYRLGKLPAKHDPRTLRLRDYLTLPAPPTSQSWAHGIRDWGMMANDRLGDCTCAAVGHAVQTATVNAATEVTIPDSAIITAYSAVSGYDPRTGANDNGAYLIDVLKLWQQTGVGGHRNNAYAKCAISNLDDVRACIALFGFCYIGFNFPAVAMQQFESGRPWDVVANDGGIEGGHAVILKGYTPTTFDATTWGANQVMTVAFFQKYVDEAWGVVLPEWLAANGMSPGGLNLQQLLADVQQLQQAPDPTPQPTPTPTPTPTPVPPQKTLADWDGDLREVMADPDFVPRSDVRTYFAAYQGWEEQATVMKSAYQGHATATGVGGHAGPPPQRPASMRKGAE